MSRWGNKYVIGLTGNIATGKSVVRQMLQHLGAYTIDADGLGHQAMQPGAPAYRPIVEKFGRFILDESNRINRKMLGDVVFANPTALKELEAITHPIINQAIDTLVNRSKQRVVVIEAIKLLEGNLAASCNTVWVVNASPKTQYTRLLTKRKMSPEDAQKRIQAQGPQQDKLAKANLVINNDGNVEETWKQVQAGWEKVKQEITGGSADETIVAPAPPPKPTVQADVDIQVRRGMPGNAEAIAQFIAKMSGREISRMDVMMSFGQKSYLLAQDGKEDVLALLGWQVENLITRADEFYLSASAPEEPVVAALVKAVEEASKELQSEVGFVFLPSDASDGVLSTFGEHGYELTGIRDIKIPAWREAVQEVISDNDALHILTKKLREDRVLKPI